MVTRSRFRSGLTIFLSTAAAVIVVGLSSRSVPPRAIAAETTETDDDIAPRVARSEDHKHVSVDDVKESEPPPAPEAYGVRI